MTARTPRQPADVAKPKPKGTKAPRGTTAKRAKKPALPPALIGLMEDRGESAANAILVAAGELFATRGPSQVSLREVAERAGANYGLIHHYFGTKEMLLAELMHRYTSYGYTFMGDDVRQTTADLFNADSGNFAEMFTWMVLDGANPRSVFGDTSSMEAYAALIERDWRQRGASVEDAPFEPRLVAAVVMFVILVWDLYAPYMRVLASLEDRELPALRDDVLAMLQHVVEASAPLPSASKPKAASTRRRSTKSAQPADPKPARRQAVSR